MAYPRRFIGYIEARQMADAERALVWASLGRMLCRQIAGLKARNSAAMQAQREAAVRGETGAEPRPRR
jgi:hypothetical protein